MRVKTAKKPVSNKTAAENSTISTTNAHAKICSTVEKKEKRKLVDVQPKEKSQPNKSFKSKEVRQLPIKHKELPVQTTNAKPKIPDPNELPIFKKTLVAFKIPKTTSGVAANQKSPIKPVVGNSQQQNAKKLFKHAINSLNTVDATPTSAPVESVINVREILGISPTSLSNNQSQACHAKIEAAKKLLNSSLRHRKSADKRPVKRVGRKSAYVDFQMALKRDAQLNVKPILKKASVK